MNWFENILKVLDARMQTPTSYGWFHLLCLLIMIVLIVVVCLTCRNLSSKQFRIITLVVSIILILFEVYKQLNFSFDSNSGNWGYQWYAFPFQFCSTPMYVLFLIGVLKENKFQNYLCSFIATFGLFAGISVMLYPNDVFVSTIGINIQTMVHHGAMVVMGIFMYVSKRVEFKHKTILKGACVFICLVLIALALNIIFHYSGNTSTFNMFYISPYFGCHLPILSIIYSNMPYIVFLLIYIFGFVLCGYIVLLIAMGINKFQSFLRNKK